MINPLKTLVKRLPPLRRLLAERNQLRLELAQLQHSYQQLQESQGFVPPGHYYSPIPSLGEVEHDKAKIFGQPPDRIPGIDLNPEGQLALLHQFAELYPTIPFKPEKQESLRFYYENPSYSYSDAIMLHCMMRQLQPNRLIEIGSGFSSCLILDTNEIFFNNAIQTLFIEPFPDLLHALISKNEQKSVRLLPHRLQDVQLEEFEALKENDILFVDSTHVSKINSDVNRIFFEILPRLNSGVYIHFHDIFFPFEYPKKWIYEGRAWNEAYLLRAFLQYNQAFSIVLMNTYMEMNYESFFQEKMPLCLLNPGGSIWIKKH